MAYTVLSEQKPNKSKINNLESAVIRFIRNSCTDLRFDKEKTDIQSYEGTSLKKNQIPYNMQMDIDRLCLENAVKRFLNTGKKEDAFDVYYCYIEMFMGGYDKTRRMIELLSEFEENGSGLLMKHRDHYSHSVYVFLLGLAIYETNEKYQEEYVKFYKKKNEFGEDGVDAENDAEVAGHFLKYWGLASLFHDIGYPFELPFEQVCSYFEVQKEDREGKPYLAYKDLDVLTKLDDKAVMAVNSGKVYEGESFSSTNELFARALNHRLGEFYSSATKEQMLLDLQKKPTEPNKYNYFMDHGYFSATVLFKKLFGEDGCEIKKVTQAHLDALTAILMHNSLYKFCIAKYKGKNNTPFKVGIHPLAYMLMLCDELQCWDRTAYGRNSRTQIHPMDCRFDFSNNKIKATYMFDKEGLGKINEFKDKYLEWCLTERKNEPIEEEFIETYKNISPNEDEEEIKKAYKKAREKWEKSIPELKSYSGMYISNIDCVSTLKDIQSIVDLSDASVMQLSIDTGIVNRSTLNRAGYLSSANFLNLYNFAAILNGRWSYAYDEEWKQARATGTEEKYFEAKKEEFMKDFNKLSLEYKLSNINQAKAFDYYLHQINCFYSDREVNFEMLEQFTEQELQIIGPLEHRRWLQEHYEMGWGYISDEDLKQEAADKFDEDVKKARENVRKHQDMIPNYKFSGEVSDAQALENYNNLGKEEQDKDTAPMECMLTMLKMFDGLRIYRLK